MTSKSALGMAKTQPVSELVGQSPCRPILTHLNSDTSWLVSFPRLPVTNEEAADTSRSSSRRYYHVVLDPWLDGELVAAHRWFLVLQHSIKAAFSTMEDIRSLIVDIEHAAGTGVANDNGEVDAVFVSHYLEDHCSRGSLTQIDPSVPVISVNQAVQTIRSWNHFQTVEIMPDLDLNHPQLLWQSPSSLPLPDYIRIGRLPSGEAFPELHWATLIAFSPDRLLGNIETTAETILYSPHGIYSNRLTNFDWATTHSRPLALLHGLDPAWYPMTANLGVANGHALAQNIRPKYWIPTHDEHLNFQGIMGLFQSRHKKTFEDALGTGEDSDGKGKEEGGKPICREVGNGESFVLV